MMKILGISGGTKNGTNDALVKEALLGAQELGADVEFIHLLDLTIKPCTGCCQCVRGKHGAINGGSGKCVIRSDDFAWIEDKMYDADGLIISMPIFEKGIPGAFECLSDRCGPSHNLARLEMARKIRAERNITDIEGPDERAWKRRCAVYFNVGGSDWVKRAASDCELFGLLPGIKTIDNITFDWGKRTLMDDARLERVHQAGAALVRALNSEEPEYIGDPGICPNCHSRLMYLDNEAGTATCLVCDIRGRLMEENGKWRFDFDPEELIRAHNTNTGKMIHAEDVRNHEQALLKLMQSPEYAERKERYKNLFPASRPPINQ